jgi:hypothetical protein
MSSRKATRAARIAWVILALMVLVTLVSAVSARTIQLRADPYGFGDAYAQLGISADQFAIYFTGIEVLFALIFITIGGLIFWKASGYPMAILVSAAFITVSIGTPLPEALMMSNPAWRWPVLLLRVLGIGLMILFLFLFPDGRFVPRWSRWLGLFTGLYLATWLIFPSLVPPVAVLAEVNSGAAARSYVPLALLVIVAVWGQIYRYRNVSDTVQRQQTKWVAVGIVGFVVIESVSLILFALSPVARQPGSDRLLFVLVFGPILLAGVTLIPITVALAILRYRLWDISVIVRRTLLYTLLTTILAIAYFIIVTVLQGIFSAVSDQQSPIVIVISTLIIAALFTPLRRAVQEFLDRQFYRRKYDADRILATFAQTARDEVDLERLVATLLAAVSEAMEPEQASLWIREMDREPGLRK